MPYRVHDIKLILIFLGLSSSYDNCFKYGLDKKVAQCSNPIIYGVESGPLLFFLCQITLPSSPSSQMAFIQKKKENEQSKRNGCLIGSPGKWLSCIFVEANVFYDTIA
jgi:hypothetical protein